MRPTSPSAVGIHVAGSAIVYRLYDVGYEIALDRALDLLASSAPERVRPVRGEGQAIQVKNPPITVILGTENVAVAGERLDAEVSARVFDFGVVSLRMRIAAPREMSWSDFSAFGNAVDAEGGLAAVFDQYVRLLTERILAAIE